MVIRETLKWRHLWPHVATASSCEPAITQEILERARTAVHKTAES